MSDTVRIVEVGPRDGLQNEKTPVSVADRIAFIEALVGAGLHTVEVGAFVSPKAIPQMVNSDAVLRGVNHTANSTCWCRTRRATRPRARPAPG
jgi:hydroxymethylglutaryl-CoA lyase